MGTKMTMTAQAEEAVRNADCLIGAERMLDAVRGMEAAEGKPMFAEYRGDQILSHLRLHPEYRNVAVLFSGDTGFHSGAKGLSDLLGKEMPGCELQIVPGIASAVYLAARFKTSWEDAALVSLHGNEKSIVPFVCYNEYVFALTGGKVRVQDMADSLIGAGFGDELTMYAGENLSLDGERIVTGTPGEIASVEFSDLAVVIIHNPNYVNRYKTLRDSDFLRAKVPMTKEAVRTIVVSELDVMPEDTVWDIGAGTGSVTCALCYRACESTVYAIEKNPAARELIEKNAAHTGARNMKVACGTAPDDLTGFPGPDKVFIGGSSGRIDEIFDLVLKANPEAVICATAVTLESLDAILSGFKDRGMEYTVKCVNVSSAEKLGAYHLMKAENPVYILKGSFADNE